MASFAGGASGFAARVADGSFAPCRATGGLALTSAAGAGRTCPPEGVAGRGTTGAPSAIAYFCGASVIASDVTIVAACICAGGGIAPAGAVFAATSGLGGRSIVGVGAETIGGFTLDALAPFGQGLGVLDSASAVFVVAPFNVGNAAGSPTGADNHLH